jgi:hypothetical protein
MHRSVIAVLLVMAFPATASPQPNAKTQKPPCAPSLGECPDQGCGTRFDAELNKRKNARSDLQIPTPRTLTWMKRLDDPENFREGETREELAGLGEGQQIAVVAYLLAVKAELGGESCNCGLRTVEATDNHLVLVSKTTVDKFPASTNAAINKKRLHSREMESETAELTPRVRLDHPNFSRAALQALIDAKPHKALLVRVSGLLLFDSEHFIKNHLVRVNNWEIHPVLKLEICSRSETCQAGSDEGWTSVDDLPRRRDTAGVFQ